MASDFVIVVVLRLVCGYNFIVNRRFVLILSRLNS